MRFFILFILLSISTITWSQKKSVLKKITTEFESGLEWCIGSVQLREDQKIVNGSIQYSEKLQTLRFNNNESIEFLSANSVMKFDFFDKEIQKERTFISMEYPVNEVLTNRDGFQSLSLNEMQNERSLAIFFELLQETKSFVVLKRITPMEVLLPNSPFYTTNIPGDPNSENPSNEERTYRRKSQYGQVITIYFMDYEGNIFPYLRRTLIEKKNSSKLIKNNTLLGKKYDSESDIKEGEKFLRKMMGEHFPIVKEFMISNKLDSEKVEDLMKIIEFYKTLEE